LIGGTVLKIIIRMDFGKSLTFLILDPDGKGWLAAGQAPQDNDQKQSVDQDVIAIIQPLDSGVGL
jgi:hypothetical protein